MPSAAVNDELKQRRVFDALVVQLPVDQQQPAIITENSRRAALPQLVKNGVILELQRIARLELEAAASLANNMKKAGRRRKTRRGRKGRKGRKHTVRKY
jgi:lipase chaperone LimK